MKLYRYGYGLKYNQLPACCCCGKYLIDPEIDIFGSIELVKIPGEYCEYCEFETLRLVEAIRYAENK